MNEARGGGTKRRAIKHGLDTKIIQMILIALPRPRQGRRKDGIDDAAAEKGWGKKREEEEEVEQDQQRQV
jgi:hypothetical protein